MGNWIQIRVACRAEDLDTVASVMSMLDNGLLIEDANEIDQMNTCYGELIDEEMKNADRTHGAVSIYVPEDRSPADHVSFIKERLGYEGIEYGISLSGMKEEDWANSWKKYFKPIRIGLSLSPHGRNMSLFREILYFRWIPAWLSAPERMRQHVFARHWWRST